MDNKNIVQPVPKDLINEDLKKSLLYSLVRFDKEEVKKIESYHKVRVGYTGRGSYIVDGQLYMWELKSLEDVVITDILYYNYCIIEKGCGTKYFIHKKEMGNFGKNLVLFGEVETIINE